MLACIFVSSSVAMAAEVKAVKDWTIMVFLNGDNNLEGAGIDDVNEMEKVGSTDKINIVCQFDRRPGYDTSNGDWKDTKIFYIEKDNDGRTIKSPVVKELGEVNMGDAAEVIKFVKFCKENYPAKHYFLSIWNHGAGWALTDFSETVKGISYDDSNGQAYMDAFELGDMTKQVKGVLGQNLDIMDFDACLMAMPCIGYQMMNNVDYMVASEETEPGDGKPYDDYLAPLAANSKMSAKDFAANVVKKYATSYNGGSQGRSSTTQSAVELAKLPALATAVKEFSAALIAAMPAEYTNIKAAFTASQAYAMSELKDLVHFAKLVSSKVPALKAVANKVIAANSAAVFANEVTGYGLADSYGLAAYMPTPYGYKANYKDLEWSKASDWDKFLAVYFKGGKAVEAPADAVVAAQLNFISRKAALGHEVDAYTDALSEKLVNSIDSNDLSGVTTLSAHLKAFEGLDAQSPAIMAIVKKVSEKLTNSYLENRSKKVQSLLDSLR